LKSQERLLSAACRPGKGSPLARTEPPAECWTATSLRPEAAGHGPPAPISESSMPRMTGAQFLADSLHAQDVTHVFFVPAILSHTLEELDRRPPIRRILAHGEKAAVYMADGYARASGRVGVSFAQCIGAANLAAGLRDPYLACSQLVVLTGGPYAQSRSRHVY